MDNNYDQQYSYNNNQYYQDYSNYYSNWGYDQNTGDYSGYNYNQYDYSNQVGFSSRPHSNAGFSSCQHDLLVLYVGSCDGVAVRISG